MPNQTVNSRDRFAIELDPGHGLLLDVVRSSFGGVRLHALGLPISLTHEEAAALGTWLVQATAEPEPEFRPLVVDGTVIGDAKRLPGEDYWTGILNDAGAKLIGEPVNVEISIDGEDVVPNPYTELIAQATHFRENGLDEPGDGVLILDLRDALVDLGSGEAHDWTAVELHSRWLRAKERLERPDRLGRVLTPAELLIRSLKDALRKHLTGLEARG